MLRSFLVLVVGWWGGDFLWFPSDFLSSLLLSHTQPSVIDEKLAAKLAASEEKLTLVEKEKVRIQKASWLA